MRTIVSLGLSSIALVCICASASADSAVVPTAWGVRLGWTAAQFLDKYGDAFPDARNDFTASAYARYPVWRMLSLQPELGWAPKGGSGETQVQLVQGGQPVTFDVQSDHRIDYLEMPLLLRFDMPMHSLMPYALLGPELAFRVGTGHSKLTYTEAATKAARGRVASPAATIFEGAGTFDQEFDAEPIDAGAIGGLGFLVESGPLRWGVEGRYTYGLLDVRSGEGFAARNSAFALTAVIELR